MAQDAVSYRMVVIGGSAGSLDVILKTVPLLPAASGATFLLVVHRKNDGDSILTNLLSHKTTMMVKEVEDKEPLQPNAIYIAPPDYHLLLEDTRSFSLDSSEKIHYSRPSIDVTFESVADVFGSAAIGILLSGANADGAEGLKQLKLAGAFTIVQSPSSADVDYMPRQAMALEEPSAVVDGEKIGSFLREMLLGIR